MSGLAAGDFEIRAAKPGFAEETRSGINLAAGQDAKVDFKMQLSTSEKAAAERRSSDACTVLHSFRHYRLLADLARHHRLWYYDVGIGRVSHGLPENAYNYEGESLVNRNARASRFVIAPNNLSQTGLGHPWQGRAFSCLAGPLYLTFPLASIRSPASLATCTNEHHQQRPAQFQLHVDR